MVLRDTCPAHLPPSNMLAGSVEVGRSHSSHTYLSGTQYSKRCGLWTIDLLKISLSLSVRRRRRQAVKLSTVSASTTTGTRSCRAVATATPLIALTGTPCTSPWIRGRSQSRNAFRKERRKTHTKTAPISSSIRCLSLCRSCCSFSIFEVLSCSNISCLQM